MRILHTADLHLGQILYQNYSRGDEHDHFFAQLEEWCGQYSPDVLLVSGDIFDIQQPGAAVKRRFNEYFVRLHETYPEMGIVITAGNHDSASRLEAPRPLLSRYKVEIRGSVHRTWEATPEGGRWMNNYDDLIIPIKNPDGEEVVVLAVPYLRSDVVQNADYSQGVNRFLRELTQRARDLHPGKPLVMMAHMYAKGAEIASKDASEKIVIGGQEEVNMEGWADHPDYLTCGHIHKRQHIWNTHWARYTGSVLPMSFAEVDYKHGVDMLTLVDNKVNVEFLEYTPQHRLRILPEADEELTLNKLKKLMDVELRPRGDDGKLSDSFDYVVLKVKMEKVSNEAIKELEDHLNSKDAVLCKIQKIIPSIDVTTIVGNQSIVTIDDILDRDPLDTLKEAYVLEHKSEMSDAQISMLRELVTSVRNETKN